MAATPIVAYKVTSADIDLLPEVPPNLVRACLFISLLNKANCLIPPLTPLDIAHFPIRRKEI